MKKPRSRVMLLVALVAVLLLIGLVANPRLNLPELPLEQVLDDIEAGRVQEIVVHNQTDVTVKYTDGNSFRTTKPADMNLLEAVNLGEDVQTPLVYREEGTNPLWIVLRSAALIILPLIAIIALYILYIGRVNAAKETKP